MSVIRTSFLLIRMLWTGLDGQGKGDYWNSSETHQIPICQKQDPGIPAWRQRLTSREELWLCHAVSCGRLHKMLFQGVLGRWDIQSISPPQNYPNYSIIQSPTSGLDVKAQSFSLHKISALAMQSDHEHWLRHHKPAWAPFTTQRWWCGLAEHST